MLVVTKHIDITNQRFGRLVAIEREGGYQIRGSVWHFRCDCGCDVSRWLHSIRNAIRLGREPKCSKDCPAG